MIPENVMPTANFYHLSRKKNLFEDHRHFASSYVIQDGRYVFQLDRVPSQTYGAEISVLHYQCSYAKSEKLIKYEPWYDYARAT